MVPWEGEVRLFYSDRRRSSRCHWLRGCQELKQGTWSIALPQVDQLQFELRNEALTIVVKKFLFLG